MWEDYLLRDSASVIGTISGQGDEQRDAGQGPRGQAVEGVSLSRRRVGGDRCSRYDEHAVATGGGSHSTC